MANQTVAALMEHRRLQVARLKLRGLTLREITRVLDVEFQLRNPATDAPWSFDVVRADFRAIRRQWRAERKAVVDQWLGDMLAEIAEVKRECWRKDDMRCLLTALRQEAELLGLNAPVKVASTDSKGNDLAPISDAERRAHVEAILREVAMLEGGQVIEVESREPMAAMPAISLSRT